MASPASERIPAMSSGEVTNIVIGVAVVALLLARQMQTRRARERSSPASS